MSLKAAVALSLTIHLTVVSLMLWMKPRPSLSHEEPPLMARLIVPEERAEPPREPVKEPGPVKRSPAPPAERRSAPEAPMQRRPEKEEGVASPPPAPPTPPAPGGAEVQKEARLPGLKELLDREMIEEIMRGGPSKKEEKGITFSTEELKHYSYMLRLKERIERIWRYPPEAVRQGIYGDLYIRFTIKKDGRLGAVELVRTSGYMELDRAALQALRDGEPYWPLPEKWGVEAITVTGHFIYTLYGTFLR